MRARRPGLLFIASALLVVTTACAGGPTVPAGSFGRDVDLSGVEVTVGGKEFDEQILLCRMTIILLRSAGATVEDACATTGSANVRAALVSGRIDMYWEYTGTAWRTYLDQNGSIDDADELFRAVQLADTGNQITWLPRTPFDDAYGIGVRDDVGERLGVRTISDLADLVRAGRPEGSLCVAQEFTGREDGLQGLLETYGFQLPDGALTTLDLPQIYPAIAAASPCTFGEVGTTDGRLNPLRLRTLVDDRRYFLPYNAALTVRTDALEENPDLARAGEALAPLLTGDVMRSLNEQVSSQHRDAGLVAESFLRERGLIG